MSSPPSHWMLLSSFSFSINIRSNPPSYRRCSHSFQMWCMICKYCPQSHIDEMSGSQFLCNGALHRILLSQKKWKVCCFGVPIVAYNFRRRNQTDLHWISLANLNSTPFFLTWSKAELESFLRTAVFFRSSKPASIWTVTDTIRVSGRNSEKKRQRHDHISNHKGEHYEI